MSNPRTLKDLIEAKPLFWLLCALVSGFAAGLAAYDGVLRIAKLEVVTHAEFLMLNSKNPSPTPSPWTGTWRSDTATYKSLLIEFAQSGDEVIGSYHVPGQTSQVAQGRICGRVRGDSLIGRWAERQGVSDMSGEIQLVLFNRGRSFVGSYTRSWERDLTRYVWSGVRIE